MLAVLSVGGSAVITSRFSTSKYFEIAKKFDVTLSTLFASTIRMLLLSKNTLFDKNNNDNPSLLSPGDNVRFRSISKEEFEKIENEK